MLLALGALSGVFLRCVAHCMWAANGGVDEVLLQPPWPAYDRIHDGLLALLPIPHCQLGYGALDVDVCPCSAADACKAGDNAPMRAHPTGSCLAEHAMKASGVDKVAACAAARLVHGALYISGPPQGAKALLCRHAPMAVRQSLGGTYQWCRPRASCLPPGRCLHPVLVFLI